MSEMDYTPADDVAMEIVLRGLLARLAVKVDANSDPDIVHAMCLLKGYHEELIMRRQDTRGLRVFITALQEQQIGH